MKKINKQPYEAGFKEESEILPAGATFSYVVLEQVRRCLELGSKDMAVPDIMHGGVSKSFGIEIIRVDRRRAFASAVERLKNLVFLDKNLPTEIKKKLAEVGKLKDLEKSDMPEASYFDYSFEWALYNSARHTFEIICGYLVGINFYSNLGRTET